MARVNPFLEPFAVFHIAPGERERVQFGFQAQERGFREAIGEVKGHMLRRFLTLDVRKIAAAVPPGSVPGSAILLNGVWTAANREIGVPRLGVGHWRMVPLG